MKFFCIQCKTEQDLDTFEEFLTKHNFKMAKANCPVCGFPLYRKLDSSLEPEKKD